MLDLSEGIEEYSQDSILKQLELFMEKIEFEAALTIANPSIATYLEETGIFRGLESLKHKKNISIRVIGPLSEPGHYTMDRISPYVESKRIASPNLSLAMLIRDRHEFLLLGFSRTGKDSMARVTVTSIVRSDNSLVVETILSTFEGWWKQADLNEKILDERKHAELLLDLITHDLGNHHQIVTPNLENIQMILDRYKNGETVKLDEQDLDDLMQFNCSAMRAIERSISLVDNIRRLEKMYRDKEAKTISIDLVSTIQSALSTVRDANKTREILFSLKVEANDKPYVVADGLLEEVFANLFSNAVKATDDSQVRIDLHIRPYVLGGTKYWMVHVSDYGKGVPEEKKPQLFERFYSKAKGSGLGLAIVRALVTRYGGKVWAGDRVLKDPAMGARFGMILKCTNG